MLTNRVEVVEQNLDRCLAELPRTVDTRAPDAPVSTNSSLSSAAALDLYTDMVRSRVLDVVARELKARNTSYYTISSAGHEHNAMVGAQLTTTDPAFLHYRSGGFVMARLRKDPSEDPVRQTILSLMASEDDPVSGGRHKVWGSATNWIPPQTSTIASHLPKATGTAFAHSRMRRLGLERTIPDDAVVMCSFGDASTNHATALAGINAARYAHRRGNPVPVLFVCEDNGIGISVDTPRNWIFNTFSDLPNLHYVAAAGPLDEVWAAVQAAVDRCRNARAPVFLHLSTVRLWGHAGSDVETGYRSISEIEADEARDPLVAAAQRLVELGVASGPQLAEIVERERETARNAAEELTGRGHLSSRATVMEPLGAAHPVQWRTDAEGTPTADARTELWRSRLPERSVAATSRTMGAHLNAALADEMLRRGNMLLFGEDVGRKGGVYHVTNNLQKRFGVNRVFDTLLDETTILGVAQGAGMLGMLPVPEIQYLAYIHNALDQIRGEAASLGFFSAGQYRNPMVVRVAGWAYQKGFGGHFHNDNAVGALRDIPGVTLVTPSRGDEAALLLRGATAMAQVDGRVVIFLEPIALYHEKDLLTPGDEGWLTDYPEPGQALLPGEVGHWTVDRDGRAVPGAPSEGDVLIVTYANGVRMSLQAAHALAPEGVRAHVVDLRWLNPLPIDAVVTAAQRAGRVLVADEARETGGGVADAVLASLVRRGFTGPMDSVASADSYVPLGPAADTVLLNAEDIADAAGRLTKR